VAARRRPAKPKKVADPAKVAAKMARREERKVAEAAAKVKALRRKRAKQSALGLLGVGVVVIAAIGVFRVLNPPELPGVITPPSVGSGHVAQGQAVTYNTPTPTGGAHTASSARCGIYTEELTAGLAVHALEHGSIVIWYATEFEDQLAPDLRRIVEAFDDRVILSPNAGLTDPIVVTAWNRLKAYEIPVDEISEFIETYRGRGPEEIPCPM
jgi:hypothetical protein